MKTLLSCVERCGKRRRRPVKPLGNCVSTQRAIVSYGLPGRNDLYKQYLIYISISIKFKNKMVKLYKKRTLKRKYKKYIKRRRTTRRKLYRTKKRPIRSLKK